MRFNALFRVFFILYCIEAGFFLLLAPWSPGWDRTVLQVPVGLVRIVFLHPLLRGAMSGFGLVHLVWSAHDLALLIARWRPRNQAGL
ncbi:MAG TPA: hypothetical protein VHR45_12730 [Thermoanaerobaculia bacterium]|nr:hypothetical protein [Thermoanaerobaculia bacterium]